MSIDYKEFEDSIIQKLKEGNLVERFNKNEFVETPNLEIIIQAFEEPSLIEFDELGLYFFDSKNEKVYCPEMLTSISEKGEWLSDKIPFVNFDIDQSGNVRKADEAEALFCCVCVAHILKEADMKAEVLKIANSYDFKNMKARNENFYTFRELLSEWQSIQSVIINILVSACKYRIQDVKKDNEKFLRDGLSSIQATELREMESKIRAINFRFSEGKLSPDNVRKLNKIERLQVIDERDTAITNVIKSSKIGVLYRLCNLSSEYISPIKKKKIMNWVRNEVDKLIAERQVGDDDIRQERSQIISKIQRRALKFETNSVRRLNIERYLEEKENFRFPSKL